MVLMLYAHVKWFTDDVSPGISLTGNEWFVVVLSVLSFLLLLTFIDRTKLHKQLTKRLDIFFKGYRKWVPLIVRLSLALMLIINLSSGNLLAENYNFDSNLITNLVTLLFITATVSMILGIYTRPGAIILIVGYLSLLFTGNISDGLDHMEYLGMGLYLLLRGPGLYSLDFKLRRMKSWFSQWRKYSLMFYRFGVGASLVSLAFGEKLLNPSLSSNFLDSHHWNFLSFIGVSNHNFILFIGVMELIIGISLILNILPRLMIMSVLIVMLATATMLGITEVYGHVFALGIFAAIIINDKKPLKMS